MPREKQPNNLVDVIGEPRVRITIVRDVPAGKNIARIILLVATIKKIQNRSSEARSEDIYLDNCNPPTPPLTSRMRSRRQTKAEEYLL
jgi:hypothetical protein